MCSIGRLGETRSTASTNVLLKPYLREILYEARNLQKGLEPGSNVHPGVNLEGGWDDEQHVESLRSAVTQTKGLLERLDDPEFPFNEFELAWNGIMCSRLQERKM